MDATPQQKQDTSSLEAPSPRWQRKPGPVGSKSLHPCSLTAPLEPRFLTCQVGVMTAEPPAGGDPQTTVELPGGPCLCQVRNSHCLAGEAVGRSLGENQGGGLPRPLFMPGQRSVRGSSHLPGESGAGMDASDILTYAADPVLESTTHGPATSGGREPRKDCKPCLQAWDLGTGDRGPCPQFSPKPAVLSPRVSQGSPIDGPAGLT